MENDNCEGESRFSSFCKLYPVKQRTMNRRGIGKAKNTKDPIVSLSSWRKQIVPITGRGTAVL